MNKPALPHRLTILLADDDPDDCLLARDALAAGGATITLRTVGDGEDLMNYLHRRNPYDADSAAPRPDLILLDLSMPKKGGLQALAEIKACPTLKRIPVVVLTTSSEQEDIARSYDLGANSFVTKPVSFDTLVEVMDSIERYWFETVRVPA